MKLYIGTAEIFTILIGLSLYIIPFTIAVYVMRMVFKINKFDKYQTAQTILLAEIAKKQGVDEEVIKEIESTLL
jgi:hypothetical protein